MALKEVQTALDRVQTLEHVVGYICMTSSGMRFIKKCFHLLILIDIIVFDKKKGVPIRTTFDEEYTKNLVTQLQPFLERIKRTIHHIGLKDIVELRLKTKNLEYLLRTDNLCTFIVVQKHEKIRNGIDE
jgi:predicted RNA-binding protein